MLHISVVEIVKKHFIFVIFAKTTTGCTAFYARLGRAGFYRYREVTSMTDRNNAEHKSRMASTI